MKAKRKHTKTTSRKNKKKRGFLTKALLLLLVGLTVAGVYYSVHNSSLFAVDQIVFLGNRHVSDRELAELMDLKKGDNLFGISSSRAVRYLESSPWVYRAELRKEFPRRLLVRISEAVPHALLKRKNDLFLLDANGTVLKKLKQAQEPFLPVIVSEAPTKHKLAFKEALKLAGVIKDIGLAKVKKRIEISGIKNGPESLVINIDGLIVKLGEGQYKDKLTRLFELSGEISRRNIPVEYVDLRFANRVIVKPVEEVVR